MRTEYLFPERITFSSLTRAPRAFVCWHCGVERTPDPSGVFLAIHRRVIQPVDFDLLERYGWPLPQRPSLIQEACSVEPPAVKLREATIAELSDVVRLCGFERYGFGHMPGPAGALPVLVEVVYGRDGSITPRTMAVH